MKIDIDKAKEKLTATIASAKELVSKENIGKASSRIAALKTKEGRQAFIADIKAMPPRGKVALSAIAAGLVIVLFCIGSCLFSGRFSFICLFLFLCSRRGRPCRNGTGSEAEYHYRCKYDGQ